MNTNLIAEITAEAISYIANLHNVTIPEVIENMMKGGNLEKGGLWQHQHLSTKIGYLNTSATNVNRA